MATRWPWPPHGGCNPQAPSFLDTACELHWASGDTTRWTLSAGPWYRDDSTRTTERTEWCEFGILLANFSLLHVALLANSFEF